VPSRNWIEQRSFWTEPRIKRLCDGIARGEPRAEIAKALGVTRNAVIGKTRRLGLSVPRMRDDGDIVRRRRLDRRNALAKLRNARAREAAMNEPPKTPAIFWRPELERQRKNVPGRPVEIWDLTEDCCRWPLWKDGQVERFYCGQTISIGSSYCPKHRREADGRKNR
jgi:hypothetical protein